MEIPYGEQYESRQNSIPHKENLNQQPIQNNS